MTPACGTALHLRGVPMAVIAKWLRHADASIAAKIDTHSQDDALREASATLGRVIARAARSPRTGSMNLVTPSLHRGPRRVESRTRADVYSQVTQYLMSAFDKRARRDSNPQPSDP